LKTIRETNLLFAAARVHIKEKKGMKSIGKNVEEVSLQPPQEAS
jgi:hypothetical protein